MQAFKAVTIDRKSYICDTVYLDGETYEEPNIEKDVNILHGKGLTVGTLEWAQKRVNEWGGIILEVEIPPEAIVVYPVEGNGKFRVSKLIIKKAI